MAEALMKTPKILNQNMVPLVTKNNYSSHYNDTKLMTNLYRNTIYRNQFYDSLV